MHFIGKIVHLQIQRASLKTGEKPNRFYSPAQLLAVPTLTLTPTGAEAHLPSGEVLLDVHNARHPETRNNENENSLSVGFTHHYTLIRQQFGEQVPFASGGENIIVETASRVELNTVANGLLVKRGEAVLAQFTNVLVAEPCKPFAGYLLGRMVDGNTLKASVQFLQNGMRGYYLRLVGEAPVKIQVGDEVWAA